MNVIETRGLGKRYGRTWVLRECTLAIPAGHLAALVGPNGAGKTTLMQMSTGLTIPTAGSATVLGGQPAGSQAALDGIAFVAQDTPVYKNLSAGDMLHLTRNLNRRFDQRYAQGRLADLGIPLRKKAGKLSGGQQAQLALTLGAGQASATAHPRRAAGDARPAGAAGLHGHGTDGHGRRRVGAAVLARARRAGPGSRLPHRAVRGRLQVDGDVNDLLASHRVLTGPAAEADKYARQLAVVQVRRAEAQAHLLVRTSRPADPVPPGWEVYPVTLEELVMAYLRAPGGTERPGPALAQHAEPTEVTR